MNGKLSLSGEYRLDFVSRSGEIETITIPNLIVDRGLGAVASILGEDFSTGIFQYFAFGDSNTSPSSSDIQLSSEVGRVEVLTKSVVGSQVTVTGKIPADEIVGFTLQEIGIFGIDATGTLNSGYLFSRALISPTITKTSVMEVNVSYVLTLS